MLSSFLLVTADVLAAGMLKGWRLALAASGTERGRVKETVAAFSAESIGTNNQQSINLAETRLTVAELTERGALDARQQLIQQLLKRMEESIKRLDQRIDEAKSKLMRSCAELRLQEMGRGQQQLRLESQNPVRALRTPQSPIGWLDLHDCSL